jgi:hypothetical protein
MYKQAATAFFRVKTAACLTELFLEIKVEAVSSSSNVGEILRDYMTLQLITQNPSYLLR